jgi:glutathione synthase/RimK-type ligase-like ATP-grasp enzyme
MRVDLATCQVLPEPDPDQELLRDALARAGVEARLHAWDAPAAPDPPADLCVVRSTWNYHLRRDEFLAWAEQTAARTPVLNPLPVLRWSTDKSYLGDLAARGVPVVPTLFLDRGAPADLAALMGEWGWRDVIIKPRVSAGSFATMRCTGPEVGEGARFLASQLRERDMMVQPYLPAVEGYGERALVWIDGELTHAVRKSPRFAGQDESVSAAVPIATDERAVAERALAGVGPGLLYGRVDLVRDASGAPLVMELELVEPSLFLRQHPPALHRLASAIRARVLELRAP